MNNNVIKGAKVMPWA